MHLTPTTHAQPIPYTIGVILDQLGGRGITGALVYCGASTPGYKCPPGDGECRSGYRSKVTPNGSVDYDVGLSFRVNGKRGENWTIIVAYEPDDTYSVYLWRRVRYTTAQLLRDPENTRIGEVIAEHHDVYCDELKRIVEQTYDNSIKTFNQGFIPG